MTDALLCALCGTNRSHQGFLLVESESGRDHVVLGGHPYPAPAHVHRLCLVALRLPVPPVGPVFKATVTL